MPRIKVIGYCSIEGCERPIKNHGICQYHYNKKRLEDNPAKRYAGVRGHPFYMLWFERKQNGILCERWLTFDNFLWDVGAKPDGEFFLVRLTDGEPFGPNNFKWVEQLRRKKHETTKEWNARKLEARKNANPNLESDRNIKRRFGMTRLDYDEKLKAQNFVCAICKEPETAFDSRTNTLRRLAVDHNHKTGAIRDLLCWRCNGTIGRINEDLELLAEMANYLIKHIMEK